jgi:uncharacterized integral membrane protein
MTGPPTIDVPEAGAPGAVPDITRVQWAPDTSAPRSSVDRSAPATESGGSRLARRARHVRLYTSAFLGVALLVYLVALATSNTDRVKVDWVFGSSSVGLVWLVLITAILGWLLGLALAGVIHARTRPHGSSREARGRVRRR